MTEGKGEGAFSCWSWVLVALLLSRQTICSSSGVPSWALSLAAEGVALGAGGSGE